jgi:CHAD domain-containing protein
MDVHITSLRNLKVSGEARHKTQILSRFAEMRSAREKKLVKMFDRAYVRELRRRLKRAEKDLRWPEEHPDPLVFASAGFARLAAANDALTEQNLHQYRIRGKQIRYVAELAGDDPRVQVFVKTLKSMQDALGEWHDWLALSEAVAKLVDSPNGSPLLSASRNIARAKLHEAVQAVTRTKNVLLGEGTLPGKKPAGSFQKITVPPRAMASAAA